MRDEDERAADEATLREAKEQIRRAELELDPVLERHDDYLIVRKTEEGGAVARALDPRDDGA